MALFSTLSDNFNVAATNTKIWTSFVTGTATISQSGGTVNCTPPSLAAGSSYAGYDSLTTYDLTGSSVFIQIAQLVAQVTGEQQYIKVQLDGNNHYDIIQENGTIQFNQTVGALPTTLSSTPWDAVATVWWRIRESGGTVFFDTSPDSKQWTNRASTPTSNFAVTALTVEFASGTYLSVASSVGKFDNFNNALTGGTTTSTSSTSSTSSSTSSTSSSTSSTSTSFSSTSVSTSSTSSSISTSSTSSSISSTSSSTSSTSTSSTSTTTSTSSTSSSVSTTSTSSTSTSSTSSSTSFSSTSTSFSSTSSSISSTSASTSSTSVSSTSSSSSTSTTTVPSQLVYSYEDRILQNLVQTYGVSTTWVAPLGITSITVECWGAGGGGGGSGNGTAVGGGGGGGGGYSKKVVTVVPLTSYAITVGAAGIGGTGANGTAGGDSWFSTTGTVIAKGGALGTFAGPGQGGAGGASASGIGDTVHSGGKGGNGASGANTNAGGGGGSGGDTTDGGAGGDGGASPGTAGTAGTTNGAAGGLATAGVGSPGSAPGGGGSGGNTSTANKAGDGGPGRVVLTYTSVGLPATGSNLANSFSSGMYSGVSVDDGDYFVQYGSEFMIQEYKRRWTNNSDAITFTWKGRSTESTLVSPMVLQIYNQNSATWETLDRETLQPADTDFIMVGTKTTSLSNYYDSNFIVTFRVYQQVV